MWEANVRAAVSKVIADLQSGKPNWDTVVSAVSDLAEEVGTQLLPKQLEPGEEPPLMNEKARVTCEELESLKAALSERSVPKALKRAETVLRVVG
jgi:hypothetical protein